MTPFQARVRNGRLVLDEPTELPEGTILDLVPADSGDELDDNGRRALHAALKRSAEEQRAGQLVDADTVLSRRRRKA